MKEKDFTRNRKMDFPKLTFFILSGTKKSLQSALLHSAVVLSLKMELTQNKHSQKQERK